MMRKSGGILWHALTVEDTEGISSFYDEIAGWQKEGLSIGEYKDFIMKSPGDEEVIVGICNARGVNKGLPAQWLMYIVAENLDKSLENCKKMGDKVLGDKRKMGEGFYCRIQEHEGAYVMLSE